MDKIGKTLAIFLTLIIAMSCLTILMVKPVNAQTPSTTLLPIPTTPDFTIVITNSSYYVPVTYSIDSSTGQEVANNSYYSGYVDALNVTLTIRNQPLALTTKSDLENGFKYFIDAKPHNSANWTQLIGGDWGVMPSIDSSTILTYQFSNPYFPVNGMREYPQNSSGLTYSPHPLLKVTVAKDEQLDFRVRAGIGNLFALSMGQVLFTGNYSDWNKLTIKMAIGETSSNLSPSPTVPELSWLAIVPLLLFLFSIAVISRHRKPISQNKPNV